MKRSGSRNRIAQPGRLGLRACSALLCAVVLVTGVPSALAAADSGRLRLLQMIEDGKDGVEGLFGPAFTALSPDGAHLYVTGYLGDSLVAFARDAQSGRLTFLETHRNGVNGVDGLGNATGIAMSPDGAHVYVASVGGNAIAAFARDPLTGRLTFVQVQRDGLPGPGVWAVIVSPDGAHVYACGEGTPNDVAVFARDAVSGRLTSIELVSTGLSPSRALALSPDGAHVYVTGFDAKAVTAFQRDAATGRLTRLASWRNGVGGVQGLDGAFGIALSGDGTSVYVASYYSHSVAIFARDAGTGMLSFVQAVQSGVEGVQGLKGARGLVVSYDGAHLWTANRADKSIALFSRDVATGRLGFAEVRRDVVAEWIGMGDVIDPALSPDGRQLYLTSISYNALLVFSTDEGGMAPIVHCVGDCDWNAKVTVDELVLGVNIALDTAALSACEMFDDDSSGTVTVDKVIRGVGNALNGCVEPLTPGNHRRRLVSGGQERIYDVHIPPGYDGSTPLPLVLDFHGFQVNPTLQAAVSGWRSLADGENFIVVHPLGLFGRPEAPEIDSRNGPSFDGGRLCCGGAFITGTDDVGFARAIVEAVSAEANVDRTRVYSTGLSNGGYMSHRLACEAADLFAAVAPVAARIGLVPTTLCQPSRPIALIEFAGLHDPAVPYEGRNLQPSAAQSLAWWRDQDGCGSGVPDERIDLGTSYCETYRSCSAGVQVELCSVEASQVSWIPGHDLYLNPDLNVARTAWEFLSRFRLPAK